MSAPRAPIDRRRFLRVIGGGALVGGGSLGSAGCASALPLTVSAAEGGVVRLTVGDHPELRSPGGSVRVRAGTAGRLVYVLAQEDGELIALSPICTHQGCTVEIEGAYLVCPCHGSTYGWDGTVVRGPAPLPLSRLPARLGADGVLAIETEGA